MVPGAFDAYLGAAATASAALVGLLFVAVSVRDDSIFGPKATPVGLGHPSDRHGSCRGRSLSRVALGNSRP
jgi:hypothetical protein